MTLLSQQDETLMRSYWAENQFLEEFWTSLRGHRSNVAAVEFTGSFSGLPSKYHVASIASASVATATLAVAEVWQARLQNAETSNIAIDRTHAGASYLCDQLATPLAWTFDEDTGDISGNYQTSDGWLRIHAMYHHHRMAALNVLGCLPTRDSVSKEILKWRKSELESAIVSSGGCAAELRTMAQWELHEQGVAISREPLFSFLGKKAGRRVFFERRVDELRPLSGLRVLDLTRVLAGPVGARFLAAYGAEVIRVDPLGFYEPNGLLIETTRGKRTLELDLKSKHGVAWFRNLLRECDVLIHGYRPGAMEGLGLSHEELTTINPGIVVVRHNAYGWEGPWRDRRGFDSLVQMSCGIAYEGERSKPKPLPAQALDYTTGYLIAAAVCRGLLEEEQETRLSLARIAKALTDKGQDGDTKMSAFQNLDAHQTVERSGWGEVRQLTCPGRIGRAIPRWNIPADKLGRHRELAWGVST